MADSECWLNHGHEVNHLLLQISESFICRAFFLRFFSSACSLQGRQGLKMYDSKYKIMDMPSLDEHTRDSVVV